MLSLSIGSAMSAAELSRELGGTRANASDHLRLLLLGSSPDTLPDLVEHDFTAAAPDQL